jgi:hypothetical protein
MGFSVTTTLWNQLPRQLARFFSRLLDGYGQTATEKAKNANSLATQLAKSSPKPRDQRDSYQNTMNQYLLDLINDVAEMAAYTAGAVNALKRASRPTLDALNIC